MINISVSIGDVVTEITTDAELSFDAIDTLLNRATNSALDAYKNYIILDDEYEPITEDDDK